MAVFDLIRPEVWRGGLIVASPHSGRDYPDWFRRLARQPELTLRSSEDAYVDHLARPALSAGAVVLLARVPRAIVDLNRDRSEVEPRAVHGARACPENPRAMAGLGVIPRVVARGRCILPRPLSPSEAAWRLEALWQPWHDALGGLMAEAVARFGQALLVDLHSMPREALATLDPRPAVVIGDRHGRSAGEATRGLVTHALEAEGFATRRNVPFAGAHILTRHGDPVRARHAVQVEIDRSLYMDEARLTPHDGLGPLAEGLGRVFLRVADGLPGTLTLAAE